MKSLINFLFYFLLAGIALASLVHCSAAQATEVSHCIKFSSRTVCFVQDSLGRHSKVEVTKAIKGLKVIRVTRNGYTATQIEAQHGKVKNTTGSDSSGARWSSVTIGKPVNSIADETTIAGSLSISN